MVRAGMVRAELPGRVTWGTPHETWTSTFVVHGETVYDTQITLRRCEADKRTVERHREHLGQCTGCTRLWPCPDLLDRADAYDVARDGETP
jgi:hypothetical protein